ncbi:small-conductance mechanosensitive channel [Candidatus Methanoperedens nitroreducens]|uniref:Small-conductance mechanosensitive channel n=1 Tax=Candidatus Methanoperedens nitratireducens TaxID=1392998 RepID=A0A062VC41_9EURY|nr:mechanosensitive ion channel family protein [Candidatus Methanoperedens nitroreducens]KCZ72860.1 small-conductance mechanosensitive channel [Candidatus Methanoperedens nitroreducens]MDJ1423214.1 mechanosensitive ion channel family protein [Candidatus Methanoperedens sp.]
MIDTLYDVYSQYTTIIKAILILVIGLIISKIISNVSGKLVTSKLGGHIGSVTKNILFYVLVVVTIIVFLGTFDINLTGILAAAGILGIVIGFAAQTSVSNIISGFFLIADKPFEIGEVIEIDGQGGHVLDISLLSTTIRTFDNRYMRIPNSTVANARIVNLSRYEIRRLDITVGIAYKENIQKALEVLDSVVKNHENVLLEPEPFILITRFGEYSIDFEIRAWIPRSELFTTRTELIKGIKNAFDEAGIEIPFPHRTVYFGDNKTAEIDSPKR